MSSGDNIIVERCGQKWTRIRHDIGDHDVGGDNRDDLSTTGWLRGGVQVT